MVEFVVVVASGPDVRVDHAVFFPTGLFGGGHCLGMCGPLVTMYADRFDTETAHVGWYEIRQHLLFNAGRTVSYAIIGATMGALGMVVFDAVAVAAIADGVRAVVGITVGVVIILVGVAYSLRGTVPLPKSIPGGGGVFERLTATMTERVDRWAASPRIVGLGMLHGLLPCPILYPALMYAFATGSPAEGSISLGLLGLGTFPTLFPYGTAFQSVSLETRERLHRGLGVAFVVLGYPPLSMGLAAVGVPVPRIGIPIYQPLG